LAFKFAGDRGEYLVAALNAARERKADQLDTGPTTFAKGVPMPGSSEDFERVGANAGDFAQEANDKAAFPYFKQFNERLMANPFIPGSDQA
jgi:hypothetical protein